MNALRLGIVSFFYLGCSPFAPGTVGTLGGVLIAWALAESANYLAWVLLASVIIYWLGRSQGRWAEEYAGKDPGIFVLDEVVGYLVTMAWLTGPTPLALVVGFFVFRFFDIFKPPPARRMEKIPGGDGILLDDVVAGLYGLGVMTLLRLFLGEPAMWNLGL